MKTAKLILAIAAVAVSVLRLISLIRKKE